jgi:neutral amino acid transport system ATP-binding protein
MSYLEIDTVSKAFGGIQALDKCSLAVEQGTITGLIGPNGSGKTTLFNVMTGFELVDTGEIRCDGKAITGMKPNKVFTRGIGRTFQLTRIFPQLTVLENLHVSLPRSLGGLMKRWGSTQEQQRAIDLLDLMNLTRLKDEPGGNLSYGQKKLLEFAIIMMAQPKIILLDEPAGGVNPTMVNELARIIREINEQRHITFLVVEHNMEFVMKLCHRVNVMHRGSKIAEGPPEEIRKNPFVLKAYLGA